MKSDRPDFSRLQVEQLETIAETLHQARIEQNLSIEQVAKQTLIQRRVLEAIEKTDLENLPEPVYIRGFIKRYALALGLKGEQIAEAFPVVPMAEPIQSSWKELPAAQLRPFHLYALYALLVIGAVMGLARYLDSRSPSVAVNPQDPPSPPAVVEPSPSPQPDAAATPAQPTASPTPAASPPPTPNGALKVDITLIDQSWMRIVVDGETQFEGMLQEGEARSLTAQEQVTLRAGNAGGVLVALNGEDAEQMGPPGSVEEVTFPSPTAAPATEE